MCRYGTCLRRTGRLVTLADFAEELARAGWCRRDDERRALASLFGAQAALERGRLPFARVRFERVGAGGAGERVERMLEDVEQAAERRPGACNEKGPPREVDLPGRAPSASR
jgi:hypothetical protein